MRRLLPLGLLFAGACAHNLRGEAPAAQAVPAREEHLAAPRKGLVGEGLASYYGNRFRGRLTANGERFNPDRPTAAHRTLPFDTCLVVENLDNGRSVRVRVNDRGPYVKGRVVDVSEGAARKLEMVEQGVARVRLYGC